MPITVKLEGVPELLTSIQRFGAATTQLTIMATAGAVARVHAAARAACPVSDEPGPFPGHLRDQIKKQLVPGQPQGAVFVERVGIGGAYGTDNRGIWVEYGTVAHYQPKLGRTHPGGGAHPFMRPAAQAEDSRYRRELEEAFSRAALEAGLR